MARTRAGSGQIQPNLKITGDQGIIIPIGTTAQRNPSPEPGEIRFNTDLNTFEGYTGLIWGGMGPFPFVKSEYFVGDGSTFSFPLEQQVSNPEDLTVLINGIQLRAGIDFIVVGQRNIVFEEDTGDINPPNSGAEISVRYFVPITSASVIANSISVEELAVVPGTTGQLLSIDQNQDLVFTSILPENAVGVNQLVYTGNTGVDGQALLKNGAGFEFGEVSTIAANTIGVRELDVSDGQLGQVLATDGNGNLTFITISGGGSGVGAVGSFFDLSGQISYNQIPDNIIDIQKLDVTDGTSGQVLGTDGSGNLTFIDVEAAQISASNLGAGQGVFAQQLANDLQFKGISVGSGLSITSNSDTITISNSSPNIAQNTFNVVAVPGQSSIAADNVSDTLTFEAGNNITIATNPATDTITINASSGGLTQNLFETIISDSGQTTADSTTDTLTIAGGTDISTSIVNDILTINWTGTVGGPDQNLFATIAADSGSTTANTTTDQLNIVGGTDLSTSITGDTLTINYTGVPATTNSFSTIAVAGQSNVTADSGSDTLTLVAGSNVTLTSDATTDTITINASAGSGGSGTVGTGVANHLAYYPADGTTIADTGPDLQWDSANDILSVVGTVDATTIQGDVIQSTGVGVPTFTSGNDLVFNAANGAGNIDVSGSKIIDLGTPASSTDAATKGYVDTEIGNIVTFPDQNLFATVAGDTGNTTANTTTDTLTVAGGTDITTSVSGDTITVAFSGTIPTDVSDLTDTTNVIPADISDLTDTGGALTAQNLFAQIDGDTGTTTANTATDVLTIAGGTDITTSISGDTVTIDYSGATPVTTFPAITQLEVTPYFSLAYRFDQYGVTDNPTIYAISGTTIAFDLTSVTPSHPFQIETTGGAQYNDGLVHVAPDGTVSTGVNAQGKIQGILYWKIPIGTTGNYAYQCTFHQAMRGTIVVKDLVTL